jgi:hypothetical protein
MAMEKQMAFREVKEKLLWIRLIATWGVNNSNPTAARKFEPDRYFTHKLLKLFRLVQYDVDFVP